jgi:hypothetical protein
MNGWTKAEEGTIASIAATLLDLQSGSSHGCNAFKFITGKKERRVISHFWAGWANRERLHVFSRYEV